MFMLLPMHHRNWDVILTGFDDAIVTMRRMRAVVRMTSISWAVFPGNEKPLLVCSCKAFSSLVNPYLAHPSPGNKVMCEQRSHTHFLWPLMLCKILIILEIRPTASLHSEALLQRILQTCVTELNHYLWFSALVLCRVPKPIPDTMGAKLGIMHCSIYTYRQIQFVTACLWIVGGKVEKTWWWSGVSMGQSLKLWSYRREETALNTAAPCHRPAVLNQ